LDNKATAIVYENGKNKKITSIIKIISRILAAPSKCLGKFGDFRI